MNAKHCALCKQHGGAHNTHNMGDCRKNEKDRTPKKAFTGKSAQHNPCSQDVLCGNIDTYVLLKANITKPEKSNKKLKHTNKKCNHHRNSDNDNSDSS